MAKKAPAYKTKLVTLHLDGKRANSGMADMVSEVLNAVAKRRLRNNEPTQGFPTGGDPVFHVNAAGDVCVYVDESSAR